MTLSSEPEVINTPTENTSSSDIVDSIQQINEELEIQQEIQEEIKEEIAVKEMIAEPLELDLTPTIHYEDPSLVTNVFVSIPDEEEIIDMEESIDSIEFDGIEENTDEVFELNI